MGIMQYIERDAPFPLLASAAPAGFGWDWAKYPIMGRKFGGKWKVTTDPKTLVNKAIWSAPIYYVWPGGPGVSDLNTGLGGYGNALNTINRAVVLGNASSAPFRVLVKPSGATTYTRALGTVTTSPTQHCAIIADGGRVRTGPFDALTYALDTGTTYVTTRSAVARVFNLSTPNAYGNYTELAMVADAATCRATPGSWAQVGTSLYVNRADGSAVTNANTRAYLNAACMPLGSASADFYLEGFDLEGGITSSIRAEGGSRNIVTNDVTTRNSGMASSPGNGIYIYDTTGLAAFFKTTGIGHFADCFNGHWVAGGVVGLAMLTVDCIGIDNGRTGNNTDNGLTTHDGIISIDINGYYEANVGPNVALVNSGTQAWVVGTTAKNSRGAGNAGEFRSDTGSKIWLEDTVADTAGRSLHLTNESTILTRNHTTIGGGANLVQSGCTLGTF